MSNYLTIQVVCKKCKKATETIGCNGFKKIQKKCCKQTIDLWTMEGVEGRIINGVLHL